MVKDKCIRMLENVSVSSGILNRPEVRRLCRLRKILRNGNRVFASDSLEPGDVVKIREVEYVVIEGGESRLGLRPKVSVAKRQVNRPVRVHCGFHKCLTMYSRKVYRKAATALFFSPEILKGRPWNFRHFFHRHDAWLENCERYGMTSLSGHALELNNFSDIRAVRFIRDPRDLIISGYYYHKRGGERWCEYVNPVDVDFELVNGVVPKGIPKGHSLKSYLENVSLEEGLTAEIEFRRKHLESMMTWPERDDRIRTYRYEDILGKEFETFREILTFYGKPAWVATKAGKIADRYRAGGKVVREGHVRNPKSQQWRELFSTDLNERFVEEYGALLERYGYPRD